jgi:hypothetical protein
MFLCSVLSYLILCSCSIFLFDTFYLCRSLENSHIPNHILSLNTFYLALKLYSLFIRFLILKTVTFSQLLYIHLLHLYRYIPLFYTFTRFAPFYQTNQHDTSNCSYHTRTDFVVTLRSFFLEKIFFTFLSKDIYLILNKINK